MKNVLMKGLPWCLVI